MKHDLTIIRSAARCRSYPFTRRGDFAITAFIAQNSHSSTGPLLLPAYDQQENQFSRAFRILRQAIADHAFPAASIAVTHQGKLIALQAFGRFTYESDSPIVVPETIFDLASVSKVVATTTMAMILWERGFLDLEAAATGIVPEFCSPDDRRNAITIRMLLAHSSGLPAHEKFYLRAKTRPELLQAVFATPLAVDPGAAVAYSDIGFILLGTALERLADATLDEFCQAEFARLLMSQTGFNPPPSLRATIAPTANDAMFRKRIIQGEVYDENAYVFGGVAGHAGLFAPASDVATFAHTLLQGGAPLVRPDTLSLFTQRQSSPPGTSRALGWDTPSSPSQSGKHFSAAAFGHLGYTGTSLWIDPERQLSVTLLTNRTWPDSSNKAITEIRPKFHDAVVEALETSQ
ncbi:MAG TPA: serine hydrolase domain-containing protein [Terriglobales bacterium]